MLYFPVNIQRFSLLGFFVCLPALVIASGLGISIFPPVSSLCIVRIDFTYLAICNCILVSFIFMQYSTMFLLVNELNCVNSFLIFRKKLSLA